MSADEPGRFAYEVYCNAVPRWTSDWASRPASERATWAAIESACIERGRTEIIAEWKAANGYDDLLVAYSDAVGRLAAVEKALEAVDRRRAQSTDWGWEAYDAARAAMKDSRRSPGGDKEHTDPAPTERHSGQLGTVPGQLYRVGRSNPRNLWRGDEPERKKPSERIRELRGAAMTSRRFMTEDEHDIHAIVAYLDELDERLRAREEE